jgi:asparagine synthase (glutamine-hydrolysing)
MTNYWHLAAAEAYPRWYAACGPLLKNELTLPAFRQLCRGAVDTEDWMTRTLGELSPTDHLAAAAAFDLRHYLPDAVLTKVDRCSMAHGLECRSPFLDHRVVEFAAQLPIHWRLDPRQGSKWILRQACRDLLPDEIVGRPKTGFGAPVGDWLRRDLSRQLAHVCLPNQGLEQWLDRGVVERLVAEHLQGTEDHTYRLWTLLALNRFWSRGW